LLFKYNSPKRGLRFFKEMVYSWEGQGKNKNSLEHLVPESKQAHKENTVMHYRTLKAV
jgi:hypothetical protein